MGLTPPAERPSPSRLPVLEVHSWFHWGSAQTRGSASLPPPISPVLPPPLPHLPRALLCSAVRPSSLSCSRSFHPGLSHSPCSPCFPLSLGSQAQPWPWGWWHPPCVVRPRVRVGQGGGPGGGDRPRDQPPFPLPASLQPAPRRPWSLCQADPRGLVRGVGWVRGGLDCTHSASLLSPRHPPTPGAQRLTPPCRLTGSPAWKSRSARGRLCPPVWVLAGAPSAAQAWQRGQG